MQAGRLEIVGIHKSFGATVVLEGITLSVEPGQRHGLIGVNGAGKTTLFNVIAGDLRADGGDIRLDGDSILRLPMRERVLAGLCRTYQISSLAPSLTVRGNLVLSLGDGSLPSLWRGWKRAGEDESLLALADELGLTDYLDEPVRELSHGAQRQLELAMVLHRQPRLLLLDEPAAGLSPAERGLLASYIRKLPSSISLLMIEHDMDIILQLSDWITVLHEGRALTAGTPEEIAQDQRVRDIYLGYGHA